jgi:hypothetical protein
MTTLLSSFILLSRSLGLTISIGRFYARVKRQLVDSLVFRSALSPPWLFLLLLVTYAFSTVVQTRVTTIPSGRNFLFADNTIIFFYPIITKLFIYISIFISSNLTFRRINDIQTWPRKGRIGTVREFLRHALSLPCLPGLTARCFWLYISIRSVCSRVKRRLVDFCGVCSALKCRKRKERAEAPSFRHPIFRLARCGDYPLLLHRGSNQLTHPEGPQDSRLLLLPVLRQGALTGQPTTQPVEGLDKLRLSLVNPTGRQLTIDVLTHSENSLLYCRAF